MKRVLTFLALVLCAVPCFAQTVTPRVCPPRPVVTGGNAFRFQHHNFNNFAFRQPIVIAQPGLGFGGFGYGAGLGYGGFNAGFGAGCYGGQAAFAPALAAAPCPCQQQQVIQTGIPSLGFNAVPQVPCNSGLGFGGFGAQSLGYGGGLGFGAGVGTGCGTGAGLGFGRGFGFGGFGRGLGFGGGILGGGVLPFVGDILGNVLGGGFGNNRFAFRRRR